MKKLMIAGAAALCATVGFSDVEGANIVGYDNPQPRKMTSLMIPDFEQIQGKLNINDLKITAGDDLGGGVVQISTMTLGGSTAATFMWIPASEAGDYDYIEGVEAGKAFWYDADNDDKADKTFEEGEGFFLSNDYAGEEVPVSIGFSGQVASGGTDLPLSNYTTPVGNVLPVKVDIQSLTVTAEDIGGGVVQISTVTLGGSTARTFMWIPENEAADYDYIEGVTGEFWYDADNDSKADYVFEPAEGFAVSNDYVGEVPAILTFPDPLTYTLPVKEEE